MTAASMALELPPSTGLPQVLLMATDFCAPARSALGCARRIARLRGATVRVLHVMDFTGASGGSSYSVVHDSAESRLRDIRRELRRAGVSESASLVAAGRPARAIRQVAAECHASMLILGINGASSSKGSTLGATARALLSHASCPVLTVAKPCAEDSLSRTKPFERPIFITDISPESLRAALAAWPAITGAREIRVVLPPDGKRRLSMDPDIPRRFAPARVLQLPEAAAILPGECAETRTGLIVLAMRAGGYLDSFATGSLAHTLITGAPCPVLTVRC